MRPTATGAFFPYDLDRLDLRGQWKNDVGVDVSTIRQFGAKFGRGVAVEPGITNLQTQTHFETNLGGFNATNGHRPADVTNQFGGWRRVPKVDKLTGVTNSEVFVNNSYTVSQTQRYTELFLFRFDGGTLPTMQITFFTNNGHHAINPTIINLGGGVYLASATYVIETGGTTLRAIDILIGPWGSATFIDIQEPLVFLHAGVQAGITSPIISSHAWGTRSAGVLKYPGYLLPRRAGTISCWIRPNYDYTAFPTAAYRGVVAAIADANNEFQLIVEGTTGAALRFAVFAGGSYAFTLTHSPAAWSPASLHHVACTWSDVEQVLYYNGARVASRSGNFTRWAEATWVDVGKLATSQWLDGLIDDLAILPRQLTDTQIAAIYA